MLIETASYANRWRRVSPGAKAGFAMAGLLAAFLADSAQAALLLALLFALLTCLGARVPVWLWLRVAVLPLGFLALGGLTLAFSWAPDSGWHWAPDAGGRIPGLLGRSLASLSVLLFLVLSTPLPDLLGLLRRLRCPEVLLDLMVVAYRMLSVLGAVGRDMRRSQEARLGYASPRRSLRSLGLLLANLVLEVWFRARGLQLAAAARNGEGGLRFLPPDFTHARRDGGLALLAGCCLLAAVLGARS